MASARVRLWLHPMLTPTEVRRLKARAAAGLRTAGAVVSELLARDLGRKGPRLPVNAGAGRRQRYSVAVVLTREQRAALETRAAAQRRSPSSNAAAVIIRHLMRQ